MSFLRHSLALLLGLSLGSLACTSTTPVLPEGIDNPHSLTTVCFRKLLSEPNTAYVVVGPKRCANQVCMHQASTDPGAPAVEVDLADCATATGDQVLAANTILRVLVGGGSKGSISLADPSAGAWVDTDASIPGWTPFTLPGLPGPMAVDTVHGVVFVLLPVEHEILSMDATLLLQGKLKLLSAVHLDFTPADLVMAQMPEPRLYISDPFGDPLAQSGGRLWQIPVAGFGGTAPTATALTGTPNSLAVAAATGHLYIGHLREGYVSVFDPVAGKVIQKIGIAPACDDGLDNDGDGLTDRDDSGCDDARDPVEGDPENGAARCADGVDNDGDGQTDAADLGCSPTHTTADACRNGKDDDGDGKTDYPDDPGCSGWGDADEGSDSVPGVGAVILECADGIDNDHDGLTDHADPDCYNRASPHEVASSDQPRTLMAATFDGHYVVAADRDRRMLHIIDTTTVSLIVPKMGSATPFQHPSLLDQRDGLAGLPLSQLPMSLGPIRYDGRDAIAIGQASGGAVILQFELQAGSATQIGLLLDPTKTDAQRLTVSSAPTLVIEGKPVDLGSSVFARYASLGRLAVDVDKSQTPNLTSYDGLTPNLNVADHRSEVWRFTFEGLLSLGTTLPAIFKTPGVLVTPRGGFCEMGVLPDDFALLTVDGDCGTLKPGVPVRYRIAAVHAESLELDPTSGRVDVPVTATNILTVDVAAVTPMPLPPTTCAGHFDLRARDWLAYGTRTGLLSSRPAADGECTPLQSWELSGARMLEPQPAAPGEVKLTHCPPYTPPSSDGLTPIQIDPALKASPFANPVFSAQLYPGCADKHLLPSIRDAAWSFAVTAGLQPRFSSVGAAPIAMSCGPTFANLYIVSQGTGALYSVNISTNVVATPLQ